MTTKQFYTIQDFRVKVKPGSFIYPYYGENVFTINKLGPRWLDKNPTIRKNNMTSWNTKFSYLSDEHLRHWLKPNAKLIKTFKCAKTLYVNWGDLIDFFGEKSTTVNSPEILAIYPKPLGIYLGEILQPIWETGENLDHCFVKVLTICGQIVWARA